MRGDGSRRAVSVVVLLLSGIPGCSWLTVRGPVRPADPAATVECTDSRAAPATDTVLAVLTGLTGAGLAVVGATHGCSGQSWNDPSLCLHSGDQAAVIGGGVALLAAGAMFTASAVNGYRTTATCRDAIVADRACKAGDPPGCAALSRIFDGKPE